MTPEKTDVRTESLNIPYVSGDHKTSELPTGNIPTIKPLEGEEGGAQATPRLQPISAAEAEFRRRFPKARYLPHTSCAQAAYEWANLDLQLNHFKCCRSSFYQSTMLRHIHSRVTKTMEGGKPGYWKKQSELANYDQVASVIACSNYEKRWQFCQCGYYGYSCGDRLFCPRCCYNLLAKPLIHEFHECPQKVAACYFVVLSLSPEPDECKRLVFNDVDQRYVDQARRKGAYEPGGLPNGESNFVGLRLTEVGDEDGCKAYWQIYNEAIMQMTGLGKPFLGAFGGPELAVRFYPRSIVLPHANYIVLSNGLSEQDVRELRKIVNTKIRNRRLPKGLYPSVFVHRIVDPKTPCASSEGIRFHRTQDESSASAPTTISENPGENKPGQGLANVIAYGEKPISVADAYKSAFEQIGDDSAALAQLTIDLNVFFEYAVKAYEGVHRIKRFGICHPSSSGYIGYVTKSRQRKRQKDRRHREKKRREVQRIRKYFPDYRPFTRNLPMEMKKMFWDMGEEYRAIITGRQTFLGASRELRKNYGRRVPRLSIRLQRPRQWGRRP